MLPYSLKLCGSKGAYETKTHHRMKIDIDGLEKEMMEAGYKIICNAKVMLIVQKGCETSIFQDGRLLLKTESEEASGRYAEEVYGIIFKQEDIE